MDTTKVALSPEEACQAIGVRRSTMNTLLMQGTIKSFKIGRLRRIPAEALRSSIERRLAEQDAGQGDR
jgi:excisionase family DNA binding protein